MVELTCTLEEAAKEAGFGPLKAKQQEALEAFVFGRDIFVALLTGYGKCACTSQVLKPPLLSGDIYNMFLPHQRKSTNS